MLRAISASNAWFPPGYSGSLSTSLPLYTLLGLTLDCAGSRLSSFGVVGIPNLLSGVSLSVSFCSSNSCCNVLCNTSLEIRKPLNLEGAYPENADTTSKLNVFPPRYVENNKYPLFLSDCPASGRTSLWANCGLSSVPLPLSEIYSRH